MRVIVFYKTVFSDTIMVKTDIFAFSLRFIVASCRHDFAENNRLPILHRIIFYYRFDYLTKCLYNNVSRSWLTQITYFDHLTNVLYTKNNAIFAACWRMELRSPRKRLRYTATPVLVDATEM